MERVGVRERPVLVRHPWLPGLQVLDQDLEVAALRIIERPKYSRARMRSRTCLATSSTVAL